ncbi:MAG: ABC transporter permease subunit [Gemmatimonadales bacterium]|nr:ABC transporter permease subunit [Gemmatimonadales bacterium]NIN11773.1 ABC transporter permease subunit [Gemmatimonadales bacterium]NIN50329.1 ABC transporter permease subunit [Gemmatimonadales bacterium]NIP07793.1 ABC transporter permease subunit [Gemmatimonadales bacterium]NIQ99225.1 ABC transporter permease subunit [Gemmatimonadales bacterium]
MIRALVGRNLRHQGRLIVALTLGLAVVELLIVQLAGLLESGPGLRDLVGAMPLPVQELFGAQLRLASFSAAVAFGFQHPVVLVAALALVIVGSTIPAGEKETGTLDLVLARPIRRGWYFSSSLVLVLLASVLLPGALLIGGIVGLGLVDAPDELQWTRYTMSAVGLATLLLALGGVSLLLASGARRRGPAVARAVALILVLYLLEVFGDLWSSLGWIRWASPFHYFNPIQSAIAGRTPVVNLLVLLAVFALTTALAFVQFNRRDV